MTQREAVLKELDELGLTEAEYVRSFPENSHTHVIPKPKLVGSCPSCGAGLVAEGAKLFCIRKAGCGYYETPGDHP